MSDTVTLEEVDLTSLDSESNISVVIKSMVEEKEPIIAITQQNYMTFESEDMRIEGTDFIEHIRNDQDVIELTIVLTDIWENGVLITHRQNELEKLKEIYNNNELVEIESNLTHDILGQTDNVTMRNVAIDDMEVTQNGESANSYDCEMTLKSLNFVESTRFKRYPTELSGLRVQEGIIDEEKVKLGYDEEEEDEEDGRLAQAWDRAKDSLVPFPKIPFPAF